MFKVLSKKTVYKSTKVQVDEEEILLPNGQTATWAVNVLPDFYMGIPITKNGEVLMTKEWRQGPHDFLTQFTGARAVHNSQEDNLDELKRELKEELGLLDGTFEKLIEISKGTRTTGRDHFFIVKDFSLGETGRDETEFQEIVVLPIKGLYEELLKRHIVAADTLLIAKILEEKFEKN